jgi:hypothetical protein
VDECGGNDGDVCADGNGEFNVVLWCGRLSVRVVAFVWRWVVGVLGELLGLGVVIVVGEEVIQKM